MVSAGQMRARASTSLSHSSTRVQQPFVSIWTPFVSSNLVRTSCTKVRAEEDAADIVEMEGFGRSGKRRKKLRKKESVTRDPNELPSQEEVKAEFPMFYNYKREEESDGMLILGTVMQSAIPIAIGLAVIVGGSAAFFFQKVGGLEPSL
eukprot:CAMPEP_0167761892 /NCGR_PEP_ID=MMETSP0110_2-20121227/12436_1 /TAXON_ID=629695 /ORGANISM="Gymnochlora sp., Strain CCMP2014" /LENGTH=148 /DNA_ID=CAMNT_0007648649 /DNA_START=187 /DNA_END=633 /DNA_ORIENTATION=-